MYPCVPFCSGAPLTFFVHPRVHCAHRLKSTVLEVHSILQMEPVRIFSVQPDPTGKFQNHRQLTGRSTGIFTFYSKFQYYCSLFNVSNEKFSKRGGWGMGEVLKFVTLDGGLRKKSKKKLRFCKNDSILRPFFFKFRFKRPVLSSAKRAQNKHKNYWRAQAKLY